VTERLVLIVATLILAIIGLLPIAAMIGQTFIVDGTFSLNAYRALFSADGHFALLVRHSLQLSLFAAVISMLIGVALGVLFGKTDLPSRVFFVLLFTAPLLIPPYVLAIAWFSVLGRTGYLGRVLPAAWSQEISSAFFGFFGCVFVLATTFMPIAMLLTMAFLRTVNPQLENAGRLVSAWPRILFRITLPLIAPAIGFAAMLIFLLALGEIGVPMYLHFPVYPVETLTQFAAFYDFRAATVAAAPLLVVTIIILGLQTGLQTRVLELGRRTPSDRTILIPLGVWRRPLFLIVLALAIVFVAMPFGALVLQSSSIAIYPVAVARAGDSILRSIVFAATSATFLAVLGLFLGYLSERRTFPVWRPNEWLGLFLLALPGSVIGIGLISLWNTKPTSFVYANPAILILGYVAQYSILPMRVMSASLSAVPRSLEDAARLTGAGWLMTMRYIVTPLVGRGLLAAWLIGYVFSVRDIAISIVVYPPGSDTLPIRILTLMANGAPSLIAALCIVLVVITLAPLGAAALWFKLGGNRP
jgi:iron(III) transport system permease protein